MKASEFVFEKWSEKYKSSINCSHPRGFSQRAHCAGKKKHNESVEMEMVCEDCGMCQTHGNINEIKKGQKDSNGYTRCWPGKHAEGTKKGKNGGQVRNCVPNESQGVEEGSNPEKVEVRFSAKEYAAMSPAQKAAKQEEWQQLKQQAKMRMQNFTLIDTDKEQGVAEDSLGLKKLHDALWTVISEQTIDEETLNEIDPGMIANLYSVFPTVAKIIVSNALNKARKEAKETSLMINVMKKHASSQPVTPQENEAMLTQFKDIVSYGLSAVAGVLTGAVAGPAAGAGVALAGAYKKELLALLQTKGPEVLIGLLKSKGKLDVVDILSAKLLGKHALPFYAPAKLATESEQKTVAKTWDQMTPQEKSSGVKEQGVAEGLNEEFDLIENIIEGIAAQNGVDAETVWADLESLTEDELYAFAVTSQLNEDWQKANKQDKTDGMSQKAVNAYRRENPGSKLKTAVTTKPSKLKKGGKASKRRKSYCSRSRGQMKMHSISCAKTPDKAICKARRRWNC